MQPERQSEQSGHSQPHTFSYYSQHLSGNKGFGGSCSTPNLRNPVASANEDAGWNYHIPNDNQLDDGVNRFYYPTGTNYRMLEN